MNSYNLIIPAEVVLPESDNLKIIVAAAQRYTADNKRYYHVEATEDEILALTLKYGKSNVWKR